MPVGHLLGLKSMENLPEFPWKIKNLKPKNIVYLGIRELDEAEKNYIKTNNIKYYTPYDIDYCGGIKNVMDEISDYL